MKSLIASGAISLAFFGVIGLAVFRPFGGGSYALVEDYLKRTANDPSSVEIQEILYGRIIKGKPSTQHVMISYRERNYFGAMSLNRIVLTIVDGRKVTRTPENEIAERIPSSEPWSHNPNGP